MVLAVASSDYRLPAMSAVGEGDGEQQSPTGAASSLSGAFS